jgi:putative redox protein
MSMISETLAFPGASGGQLVARLERPDDAHWATALFAHCFTCSKDLKAVRRISRALVDEGVAVFTFDFTGLGESEGDLADTNFSSNLDDLEAACRHLEAVLEPPSLLLGHSLGGAAVLAVAERIPEVKAVATIGAPSDPAHLARTLERAAPQLAAEAEAQVSLGGRPFRIRQQLLEDLRGQRLRDAIANLSRPLLIFHSPIDDIVGIEHARKIYDAAKHPKSFISLDSADHLLFQNPEDAAFIGRALAAWMTRYVRPPDVTRSVAPLPHGEVLVDGRALGFRQHDPGGRSSPIGRRACQLGWNRHRPQSLRVSPRSARRVHVDNPAHVCRSQGVAARRHSGATRPREDPCEGLWRLRDDSGPDRPDHHGHRGGRSAR